MTFKSRIGAGLVSLIALFSAGSHANQYTPEQVKSVYLFRIANFIHWHNEKAMDAIHYCIEDSREVKATFSMLTHGKAVRGLAIETSDPKSQSHCDIVFVSGNLGDINIEEYPKHALTVSDVDGFTTIGGMIQLESVNNRIRPVINTNNIKQAPFRIGASLMRVSRVEGNQ